MIRNNAVRARIIITLAMLLVMASPLSQSTWAQTPDAPIVPPVVTEIPTEVPTEIPTEVPPPPVTEVPTPIPTDVPPPPPTAVPPVETEVLPTEAQVVPVETQVVPTETEVVVETPTEVPTENPTEVAVTETVAAPSTPTEEAKVATPTPTEEVINPDQLELVSAGAVTIGPGESRDITVRYTLGSDRNKTEITVNLASPAGESLAGWSITPVNRGDTLENPNDANRMYKAGIDETSAIQRENTFDSTWRLTAPAHIENPLILNMSFSAKTHRDDGVTDGAIQANFVTATAIASVHTPVLNCTAAVGEGIANTWNCAFDTTHPDPITINASAVVPTGWELKLNTAGELTDVATPLDSMVVEAGAFTLSADYPFGCPDAGAMASAILSLEFTYPSGEVSTLTQDLALTFERPSPTLDVTSFEFTEFNILESLSTTGALTISYADAPCDWVATIEIADLHSDTFTVSDAVISITGSEGRADALISITDGTILIQAPESASNASSGEITIYLQINLPHLIPPGSYAIGVVTEIKLRDEN